VTLDEREQLLARLKAFDAEAKTWTPEQALAYLVKLGTHTPRGELAPEYGGPKT